MMKKEKVRRHFEIEVPKEIGVARIFLISGVPPGTQIGHEMCFSVNSVSGALVQLKVVRVYCYPKLGWNRRYVCDVYEPPTRSKGPTELLSVEHWRDLIRDLESAEIKGEVKWG